MRLGAPVAPGGQAPLHLIHGARKALLTQTLGSLSLIACAAAGCAQGSTQVPCADPRAPGTAVDCSGARCPAIAIAGDAPAANAGTFRGYADPTIAHDPAAPPRVWLAYSWPHLVPGGAPDGSTVLMAAVSTHLARSDDGGRVFSYAGELWSAVPTADPEGSGENGINSSETASLVPIASGGTVTWYGAHLRYFLEPQTGYHPKYGTSWTVRIGAAASPPELAAASEAVLGVSATAATYRPDVRLDQLAGLPLARCAMLNNPALFAKDGRLYLIVECLAFVGTTLDFAHSTTQVFATVPTGPPAGWIWRHAGMLADHGLAQELGDDTIQQPDVSLAAAGTPILIVTPAHADAAAQVGTRGDGCVALELASIDPPALARDCSGQAIVRARVDGAGVGACTHDPASVTGIVSTTKADIDGSWTIRASGARP